MRGPMKRTFEGKPTKGRGSMGRQKIMERERDGEREKDKYREIYRGTKVRLRDSDDANLK